MRPRIFSCVLPTLAPLRHGEIKNSNSVGLFGWIRLCFVLRKSSAKG